ncbi:MAG TPA: metal ABC transporter permease [Thermoanaerobaculia bacterium]|nr:metal ABC transporter permease [Thermoanaerobaculia bacterium]
MTTSAVLSVILGLSTAVVAGLVGSFALMKRMTLAGDVVSHFTLPGLGIAFLWGLNPLVGAAATLAIGILMIDQLQRRSGLATETAIGVVFVGALAVGTLLTPTEDLIDALFGGFREIKPAGFALGIVACAVVLLTIFALRHRLILIIFSPDLAAATKINVARVNFIYLCLFGVTILLGLRFLGALLVGAMIIVPAAIGRRFATSLDGFLIASSLASVVAVAAGFVVASHWHLSLGPTIVGVASAMFGASLVKPVRSRVTDGL